MVDRARVRGEEGRGIQETRMADDQAAEALSSILGKKVIAQQPPLSAVVPTYKSFGFSDEAAQLFEEMYAGFSTGMIGYEQPASVVRGTITLGEALRAMV